MKSKILMLGASLVVTFSLTLNVVLLSGSSLLASDNPDRMPNSQSVQQEQDGDLGQRMLERMDRHHAEMRPLMEEMAGMMDSMNDMMGQ